MKRSDIPTPRNYFNTYIDQVDDLDIHDALAQSLRQLRQLDREKLMAIGERVYAERKWTIREHFQHLIDVEHVMSYRALRLGRYDTTPLPGFDQDIFAAHVQPAPLPELIDELMIIRQSTQRLFRSFTPEALGQQGQVSDMIMCPLALGFTIVGHQVHHLKIIAERYR